MKWQTLSLGAVALLGGLAGCDRAPTRPSPDPVAGQAPVPVPAPAAANPERLAHLFAKALRNAEFRAYLKAQLDASPFPEHKLQFQTFLGANGKRALNTIAAENGESADAIAQDAAAAIPLELYLPVPAHRAAWTGDDNVLVATAIKDGDVPVAFDPAGHRQLLDPAQPPATPVLAVVPVETDFSHPPARAQCYDSCTSGGGGTDLLPPGLYMTASHIPDIGKFESWLKGNPEFEVHILGQDGTTSVLKDYQCAGELAGGPFYYDQNGNDWSGSVLLFSQQQLDGFKAAHPGQAIRVVVVEDDDTACEIKTDQDRFNRMLFVVDSLYAAQTGGRDSTAGTTKWYNYAHAGQSIFSALASLIKTNDDLVGDAVQDVIVGQFYPGYNWFLKGENNVTNGWVKLEIH